MSPRNKLIHWRHVMILGMGASELVVILLVALVIFGPKTPQDDVEDADA